MSNKQLDESTSRVVGFMDNFFIGGFFFTLGVMGTATAISGLIDINATGSVLMKYSGLNPAMVAVIGAVVCAASLAFMFYPLMSRKIATT